MLNLRDLEKRLFESLDNESDESLMEWVRNYELQEAKTNRINSTSDRYSWKMKTEELPFEDVLIDFAGFECLPALNYCDIIENNNIKTKISSPPNRRVRSELTNNIEIIKKTPKYSESFFYVYLHGE